jgi:hypothetical protein
VGSEEVCVEINAAFAGRGKSTGLLLLCGREGEEKGGSLKGRRLMCRHMCNQGRKGGS